MTHDNYTLHQMMLAQGKAVHAHTEKYPHIINVVIDEKTKRVHSDTRGE